MHRKTRHRLTASVVGASMVLTACGGGDPVETGSLAPDTQTADAPLESSAPAAEAADSGSSDGTSAPASSDGTEAPAAPAGNGLDESVVSVDEAASAAEANKESLTITDDARTTQVLNVKNGTKATLQDAVIGDRPVLLWFFSPH